MSTTSCGRSRARAIRCGGPTTASTRARTSWPHLDPGPLLLGRTLPWLALQFLAVTTVLAAIVSAIRLVRSGPRATGEALRLGLLLLAGAVFACWSAYWGLIFP